MKSHHPEHEQQLERLTHQALRELPPCPAPASLEARVLRTLEQHAQPSGAAVARWPRTVRAVLIAACALCVPLVWMLAALLRGHVTQVLSDSSIGHVIMGVSGTSRALLGLGELAVRLAHLIPSDWLLGGLFILSAVYAGLIALVYLLLYPTLRHSKAHSV